MVFHKWQNCRNFALGIYEQLIFYDYEREEIAF